MPSSDDLEDGPVGRRTDADDCERCGDLVRRRGDHTCPPCAAFLGRSTLDPFWGAFPNHPDSTLLPSRKELAHG